MTAFPAASAEAPGSLSWGRMAATPAATLRIARKDDLPAFFSGETLLAVGAGRSYGDVGLNSGGRILDMRGLDRILSFDPVTGKVEAEAGVTLAALIDQALPRGWLPAVLPGTRFVTLGGAVANDIHGKNHHGAGSFGRHVEAVTLWRSDGGPIHCSPTENADLFRATIGGLGLTGAILSVRLRLARAPANAMAVENLPTRDLAETLERSLAAASFPYVVAWVDSLASGANLGRGIVMRARMAEQGLPPTPTDRPPRLGVPFTPPVSLVNGLTMAAFNAAFRLAPREASAIQPLASYFFPLDAIGNWNRLYGPNGLAQHQSVVPLDRAEATLRALIEATHKVGAASFLTVLKIFGDQPAPGLMSFSRPGVTLTLDFGYRGAATDALLAELDRITIEAGGALNPSKDRAMSAKSFAASFPNWRARAQPRDPAFSSSFWRRVTGPLLD